MDRVCRGAQLTSQCDWLVILTIDKRGCHVSLQTGQDKCASLGHGCLQQDRAVGESAGDFADGLGRNTGTLSAGGLGLKKFGLEMLGFKAVCDIMHQEP